MDTATSDIRGVECTPRRDSDSPMLPDPPGQIPEGEQIGTVTADGAYDARRYHTAIIDRQAAPIIPIRKKGRPGKEDCPAAIARNETLRATRLYGRALRKRWTGHHVRSRIEAKMRCLNAFGQRIAARHPESQTAEIQIRVALIHRFTPKLRRRSVPVSHRTPPGSSVGALRKTRASPQDQAWHASALALSTVARSWIEPFHAGKASGLGSEFPGWPARIGGDFLRVPDRPPSTRDHDLVMLKKMAMPRCGGLLDQGWHGPKGAGRSTIGPGSGGPELGLPIPVGSAH
jgi:hypothetical protein